MEKAMDRCTDVRYAFLSIGAEYLLRVSMAERNEILAPLYDSLKNFGPLVTSGQGPFCPWHLYQGFAYNLSSVLPLVYGPNGLAHSTGFRKYRIPKVYDFGFNGNEKLSAHNLGHLLSALKEPLFPRVTMNILERFGKNRKDVGFDADLLEQLILDMDALAHSIAPPTYVKSKEYTDRASSIFSQITFLGTFPEETNPSSREADWRSTKKFGKWLGRLRHDGDLARPQALSNQRQLINSIPLGYTGDSIHASRPAQDLDDESPTHSSTDTDLPSPITESSPKQATRISLSRSPSQPESQTSNQAPSRHANFQVSGNPGIASSRRSSYRNRFSASPFSSSGVVKTRQSKTQRLKAALFKDQSTSHQKQPKKHVHYSKLNRDMLCSVPRAAYNDRATLYDENSGLRLRSIIRPEFQKSESMAKPEKIPVGTLNNQHINGSENQHGHQLGSPARSTSEHEKSEPEVPAKSPEAIRRKILAIFEMDILDDLDLQTATYGLQSPQSASSNPLPINNPASAMKAKQCIDEIIDQASELKISDQAQAEVDNIKHQRELREKEEARFAQEAKDQILAELAEHQQRLLEEQNRREREEALKKFGGLRRPKSPLVAPLSSEWTKRALDTLQASSTTELATTPEGTSLRRHDFQKVVNERVWLNDEIVNGTFLWLDKAINSAAGIKNVKAQTRKCLSLNSFFWKQLMDKGVTQTQRALRRYGVNKNNLLDIDSVFIPVCENDHWTVLAIRPSSRTVSHMDSLNPGAYRRRTNVALAWLKAFLEEKFVDDEWKVVNHDAPRQINGYDCGVHTITNVMCIALGLHPGSCFDAHDMPMQRLRVASVLLNNGFSGEFDLSKH